MECKQPGVRVPVDFEGIHLNVQIDTVTGKVWVCIDGEAVLRAKGLSIVTVDGEIKRWDTKEIS